MHTKSKNKASPSTKNSASYATIVEFSKFLRQNGDKLFEKDSKLCLQAEQFLILQEYLQEINHYQKQTPPNEESLNKRKNSALFNVNDFITLYKSNHLHLIQDFLFKITNLKVIADSLPVQPNDVLNLQIFGSITYLEIKNVPVINVSNLQYLRYQVEVIVCNHSMNLPHELLYQCGRDNCNSPVNWPKLHTLNLSFNQFSRLDDNFRLTTSIEILDLSHNNLTECNSYLHSLVKLKKLNLSFNNLNTIPSLCDESGFSSIEYLDLSYNNIESIDPDKVDKLESLKHLNLKSNLINSINQLNNLNKLTSATYISVKQNPISENPVSESIIKEIIDLVAYNKNNKQSHDYVFPKPMSKQAATSNAKAKSTEIQIRQSLVAGDGTTASNLMSPSVASSFGGMSLGRRKAKLKVNNVLIDNNEEEEEGPNPEKDYVLINSVTHEEQINSLKDLLPVVNNEYESDKLQSEIENMKKMRQNYGTDWLLSAPNLQIDNVSETDAKSHKDNNGNDSDLSSIEPIDEKPEDEIDQDSRLQPNPNSLRHSISHIVESFVVYRITSTQADGNNSEKTEICVVSLSDTCLIEKDELNAEILAINYLLELADIEITNKDDNKKLILKFQSSTTSTAYQFENNEEFDMFIDVFRKILFNKYNTKSCQLVYCVWCAQFVKKSKFSFVDEKNGDTGGDSDSIISTSSAEAERSAEYIESNEFENLTCTLCDRYLIKDQRIQDVGDQVDESANNTSTVGEAFTLKDALASFNDNDSASIENVLEGEEQVLGDLLPVVDGGTAAEEGEISEEDATCKLESFLNNNKLAKTRMDEVTAECKRISNNLKLYLIVNVLKSDESNELLTASTEDGNSIETTDEEEETPISIFRMKFFFYLKILTEEEIKQNASPMKRIDNCLVLLTNKNLIVFKLLDIDMFNQNADFDVCLKRKLTVDINHIELIEIGLGQNYLLIEKNTGDKNSRILNYKFVTLDLYQSQVFLNVLLKIINESKKITMLKNIRKKNDDTIQNLLNLVNTIDPPKADVLPGELPITLFTLIENLTINGKSTKVSHFEYGIQVLFLYNNEHIILLEENLNYDPSLNVKQFHLVGNARICDIVHLKLLKDFDRRLEISLVDELSNSANVTWLFEMSEAHILSQFIVNLKATWEQIFSIEMPINY